MKLTHLISLLFTSVILMGCQIEVLPMDEANDSSQTANEAQTETSADSGSTDTGDTDTGNDDAGSDDSGADTGSDETGNEEAPSASVSIRWEMPVERENNEQLFIYEIGGYEIEYRRVGSDSYETTIIEDGAIEEYEFTELEAGTYEFRIAAYDTNGLYSRFSEPAILEAS